ncbi:MAG: hypothetical protein KBD31_01915 [Proteobacteria bacterium]|nr:hypothetical protein [Pseudomonadota bacterium]
MIFLKKQKSLKILKGVAFAAILNFSMADSVVFAAAPATASVKPAAAVKGVKPLKRDPLDFVRPQLDSLKANREQIAQLEKAAVDFIADNNDKKQTLESKNSDTISEVAAILTEKGNTNRADLYRFMNNQKDQAEFTTYLEKLNGVLPDYKTLLGSLSKKERSLTGLQKNIEKLKANGKALEEQLNPLNDELQTADAAFKQGLSQNTQNVAQRNALMDQMNDLQTKILVATRDKALLASDIDDLKARINDNKEEIASLNPTNDAKVSKSKAYQTAVARMNAETATMQSEITAKDALQKEKETEIAALTQQQNQLSLSLQKLDPAVATSDKDIRAKRQKINAINIQIELINDKKNKADRKISKTEMAIVTLKQQVEVSRKNVMENLRPLINLLSGIPFIPEASSENTSEPAAENVLANPVAPAEEEKDISTEFPDINQLLNDANAVTATTVPNASEEVNDSLDQGLTPSESTEIFADAGTSTVPTSPTTPAASPLPIALKKEADASKFLGSVMASPKRCALIVNAYPQFNDGGKRLLIAELNANKSLLKTGPKGQYVTIFAKNFADQATAATSICK